MALLADRVRGLLKVKNRQQNELAGIDANLLAKWLGRFKKVYDDDLKQLAEALESTSDYLIGLGDDYRGGSDQDNYAFAAAKMSFTYFIRDLKPTSDQRQRCRRVWEDDQLMMREGAPMTAEAWKSLAEMIDRAVPTPPKIEAAKGA